MTSLIIFILGLCIGSFLNVFVYRLPRSLGFISGRSFCPHCSVPLRARDLLPLLSFLMLRGRCRNCSVKISWRYPVIELLFGILCVLAFVYIAPFFGLLNLAFAILFLFFFVAIGLIDFEYYIIPDSILIALLVCGSVLGIIEYLGYTPHFLGILSVSHVIWGVMASGATWLMWLYSKGTWIGFGDVKYIFILGFLFGAGSLPALYTAIISGALVGVCLVLFKKMSGRTKLPFGVFLSAGAVAFLIGGWNLAGRFEFFDMIHYYFG